MLGHPTNRGFLGVVHGKMISNCPVTKNVVTDAQQIFGPDLGGIRGRMVRRPLESVNTDYVQIPRAITEGHQPATLTVDVMFVSGVPFLVNVARGLNLVTLKFMPSRTETIACSRYHPDDTSVHLRGIPGGYSLDGQ
jgi:hypothetical protein